MQSLLEPLEKLILIYRYIIIEINTKTIYQIYKGLNLVLLPHNPEIV